WKLERNYTITAELTIHEAPRRRPEPGYSLGGVAFGSRTLYESWNFKARRGDAAWFAAWRDDGRFGVYDHATDRPVSKAAETEGPVPKAGDKATIEVALSGSSGSMATIDA